MKRNFFVLGFLILVFLNIGNLLPNKFVKNHVKKEVFPVDIKDHGIKSSGVAIVSEWVLNTNIVES